MKLKAAASLVIASTLALVASPSFAAEVPVMSPVGGGGDASGSGNSTTGGNQTACGAILCLAGAAMEGKAPSSCSSYIEKYFAIQVFHHGDFSPSRTVSSRMNFLNQCQGSDSNTKNLVNNRYGGQMSF